MKKTNGITLIALVITIIILLILAGVSISAITGENGIVQKSKEAAEKTEAAEQKELETLGNFESQINEALLKQNEYGFYFDTEYAYYDYWNTGRKDDRITAVFKENNTIEINHIEDKDFKEGKSYTLVDFAGQTYVTIESLEYNKTYSGKGTFNSDCSCYVDNDGNLYTNIIINSDTVKYESDSVDINNGSVIINFTNEGKTFDFNGRAFSLET